MAWSRALRAADSASRIPPLKNFDGGKRGRTHQFYEAVAFDQKFQRSVASLSECWQISQQWRHIQHFRETLKFLHLSQLRSKPDIRIHLVDDGKLPFLSEFGENWGVVARKTAVVFSRLQQHAVW